MSESKSSQNAVARVGKVKFDGKAWGNRAARTLLEVDGDQVFVQSSIRKEDLRMTRVGLCAALRSPLVFAQRLFARWNRQALNAKALACITSCGGRIAISYPADRRTLPVLLGLNGGQMFDPDARIHIWLPALSVAQWSELKPCLQSLATLVSLQIAGRNIAGADCPDKPCDSMSAMEAHGGCRHFPLMEPLLVGAPE
ncbi:MAG: hypothetical protein JNK76_20655 [Planctomycetales bacterium]|nr:hypothetical protein [Planctomycetales bacterium]